LVGFVLAILAVLILSFRLITHTIYWADPDKRDQSIQPWMTPHYVSMSWDVDPEVVLSVTGPKPQQRHPTTIEDFARARGVPVFDLIRDIDAAIAADRATP
jgi:hypothetical protein